MLVLYSDHKMPSGFQRQFVEVRTLHMSLFKISVFIYYLNYKLTKFLCGIQS